MDRLDPRSLEVFQAVVETGSATLASRKLHLTQPTVTRAVAALENRIGVALFERGRFGMRPTAEGLLFADEIRRSFAGLDRLTAVADAIRRGVRGQITIAAMPIYAEGFLPRAVGKLAADGDFQVRIESHSPEEIVRRVLQDQADIGVLMGAPPPHAQVDACLLGHRRLVAVMDRSHALAGAVSLGAEDLAAVDLVLMASPNPYRNLVQEAFSRAGVRPQSRMEASTQRGAAWLALSSGALALVDQEIADELRGTADDIHVAAFTGASAWNVMAIWSRLRTPTLVADAVLTTLRDGMAEASEG